MSVRTIIAFVEWVSLDTTLHACDLSPAYDDILYNSRVLPVRLTLSQQHGDHDIQNCLCYLARYDNLYPGRMTETVRCNFCGRTNHEAGPMLEKSERQVRHRWVRDCIRGSDAVR